MRGNGKFRIGWDLDGVITHTEVSFLREAQQRGLLLGVTPEMISRYNWEEAFPGQISPAQVKELYTTVPSVYTDAPACGHVLRAMRLVQDLGGENEIVTARFGGPTVKEDTLAWLERHAVPYDYMAWHGVTDKLAHSLERGHLTFVEDRMATANHIAQELPAYLVAASYNNPWPHLGETLHPGVYRRDRSQVEGFLRGLIAGWKLGVERGAAPVN